MKLEYKKYEEFLNKVIKDEKYKFEQKLFDQVNKDSKSIWSYINKKINRGKTNHTRIEQIDHNGKNIDNPGEIANIFNDFFRTICQKLEGDIVTSS